MGRRSRKRRPGDPRDSGPSPARSDRAGSRATDRSSELRSRGARRDAEARERLEPLAAGERPVSIVVAALVAVGLAAANVAAYLTGTRIQGKAPGPATLAGVLVFSGVMIIAAVGMWRLRYWAVLGFQALLALVIITFSLLLVRAGDAVAALLCVAVVSAGGALFWKLVRAMARIQMPVRPRGQ